jgi:hypothetical protein
MAASVSGGFWPNNGVTTLNSIETTSAPRRRIAQLLADKSMMDDRALINALLGAAAGSNATKTLSRVQAAEDLSGARTIETETLINRNTTAGDVTTLKANLVNLTSKTTFGSSPVANLDGNPLGTR